jgi:uncharacterized protein (TIGR03083 family)
MDHRASWRAAAGRFADVLDGAPLDAPVPGCPGWEVADLAFHLGKVYDRFMQVATGRLTALEDVRALPRSQRPEDDRELPGWFRERVDALDTALTNLRDYEPLWNFTTAPQVAAWLPRRMLHETTVHRVDLEEATGTPTPVVADIARDGVDEYLTVLSTTARPGADVVGLGLRVEEVPGGPSWQVRAEPGAVLVVAAPPPGAGRFGPDGVDGAAADADVVLRGDAATLLLVLWRRLPLASVEVAGREDAALALLAALAR